MKYISEEIDSILEVKHLELVFLMNSIKDKRFVLDTARSFYIDPPDVTQSDFATTLIKEARSISNYESVPVPVMNILLEHGKNFIVSAF